MSAEIEQASLEAKLVKTELNSEANSGEDDQILNVLQSDKKYQNEHGQKLFNAINCLLDDEEQLELTQALFKYQSEYNVFTLVRSCCELFDTPRKKSLMLFMRPVIPVKDRFHYDEYYKLFFPEEFAPGQAKSIFSELIPKELLEKTLQKAHEKKVLNMEKAKESEAAECLNAIKLLEKVNSELNADIQKLMSDSGKEATQMLSANPSNIHIRKIDELRDLAGEMQMPVQIAGFRIIEIAPAENESLGFDVCMGPTGTFIMISYVEPDSLVAKLGMKPGDELVSVNETSFKMITLDQAIDILSSEATMRIVLQTSGFMPEFLDEPEVLENADGIYFDNQWTDPFGKPTSAPSEDKNTLKRFIRRILISPKSTNDLGIQIRGGIEFSLGIFISKIEPKSEAALAGLRVGDQIIEVNGQIFSRISQAEAVKAIKHSIINYYTNKSPIKFTVRYLGKLPQLLARQRESVEAVQEVEANLEDESIDSEIIMNESFISLVNTSSVLKEEDLLGQDFLHSKVNNHSEGLTNQKLKRLESSIRTHFDSQHDFNLFRYYLSDYLNSRINVQYFLYLITNRLVKSFKRLIDSEQLHSLIKVMDVPVFEKFVDSRKELLTVEVEDKTNDEEAASSYVYFMCPEYKKRFMTRSNECFPLENGLEHHKKALDNSLDNLVQLN